MQPAGSPKWTASALLCSLLRSYSRTGQQLELIYFLLLSPRHADLTRYSQCWRGVLLCSLLDAGVRCLGGGGWGTAAMHTCTDYCLRKKECRCGFGEENKLIQFVAIARPGTRIVEEKEAELKINPWDTYLAAMQKKIPDRHGQMQYVSADTLCFDVHAAREDKVCPVWTFWKTRAVWPLDSTEGESYCEDSLMRFKPVRALADVKGNHATYSAAMIAFLEHPHCPAGLQRQVARARLDHDTE